MKKSVFGNINFLKRISIFPNQKIYLTAESFPDRIEN